MNANWSSFTKDGSMYPLNFSLVLGVKQYTHSNGQKATATRVSCKWICSKIQMHVKQVTLLQHWSIWIRTQMKCLISSPDQVRAFETYLNPFTSRKWGLTRHFQVYKCTYSIISENPKKGKGRKPRKDAIRGEEVLLYRKGMKERGNDWKELLKFFVQPKDMKRLSDKSTTKKQFSRSAIV